MQLVDFLKIDVEVEVSREARNTIARHRPVIYAENDRNERLNRPGFSGGHLV